MGRILLLCSFLFLISFSITAQQFGGNPPRLKWKQIDTDTARIIFPAGFDSTANRVASVVHFLAAKNKSLGDRLYKINIVLQNQTTIANGYAGLGPYRSEFFMTPPMNNFDLGSIEWATSLAVHEYRHVQQYNNFRTGLSNAMYYLFGEEGLALAINASVPDWFYEGDAVYNETVFTGQGRGRIPHFTNQYQSLWVAGKNYSWMKLRNGSLKDYVPSHYPLGYLLVNYGYEKYGADFWKKVTQDAAAFKGLFYPFQRAIKAHAGVDYTTFRKQAFDFYKNSMGAAPSAAIQKGEQVISANRKDYLTHYLFPYQLGDDSILFLKTSYRHRPAFYIKDKTGEHRLRTRDIAINDQFSYKNGKIVYAAYEPDARWGWKDYSVIRVLDLRDGQQQKLTSRTKYFSPDISEDGSRVVAVNYAEAGKSELHILSATDGSVLQQIHSSEITLFTDPKFIDENNLVTAVRFSDGKMSLAHVDLETGSLERLTPPSYNVIGYPAVDKGIVYFTASYAGNDDLFAIDLKSKNIYQVSQGVLGNYFANAKNGKLLYSNFSSDGYQLKTMAIPGLKLNEVNGLAWQESMQRIGVANASAFNHLQLNNIAQRNFPAKNYSKGTGLFNFHSWRPYYEDPEFTFSLYGENVLNTFRTEIYYLYNQDERTHAAGLNAVYGGLFPFISAGTEFTFNRTGITNNMTRQWNQLDSRVGLSIPMNFSGGRFFRFLNFGSNYVFRNEFNTGPNQQLFAENNFSYLSHFITWSQQVQRAVQHIFPRAGYNFLLQQRHAITKYDSYQFHGSATVYLPGLLSNHHIVLSGAFQQRDTTRALFGNGFADARGYISYYRTTAGSRMWRLSANYHLPLLLPDWGFANILYLQRIRANLFYDFQRLYSNNKLLTADLRSAGAELYVDTQWWNQYPLTFGLRVNHLLDDDPRAGRGAGSTWVEFVLPVSIIPR